MPRPRNQVPTYRLHKQSGQAIVTVTSGGVRKDITLGKYGTPESKAEYERVLHSLRAPGGAAFLASPASTDGGHGRTVAEVLLVFWEYAERHYRNPADDSPTSELHNYGLAFKSVREMYAHTPASEFGPRALKACRQWMIDKGWVRKQINLHVGRIKRCFKWAASEELIPATVYQALTTVAGLQKGRTEAKDRAPIPPVADEHVDATLPHLNRHVRGIVEFQRLTGCRPTESCKLRRCDLDTTGPVWLYRPPFHKTAYRGKARTIPIGPQAQALLATFPIDDPAAFVFSPARAVAEFQAARTAARKTPKYASHMKRNANVRKAAPKRKPGERYTVTAYEHAIARGCKKAGVPHWHPNQLRHSFATTVRKAHGLEAAQVLLGHSRADVTQVYAERDETLATAIAAKIG